MCVQGVYIVRQNPQDKKWYVLGSIKDKKDKKIYFMPVSIGYDSRFKACVYKDLQPRVDEDAKNCLKDI